VTESEVAMQRHDWGRDCLSGTITAAHVRGRHADGQLTASGMR
jgi:hypothetical protein